MTHVYLICDFFVLLSTCYWITLCALLKKFDKKMVEIYRNLIGILYNFYQNLSYLSDIKIITDGKVINFYRLKFYILY